MDPDTRHAHKTRERRQDGFKAHVVAEPDSGLTTVCELTKTNGSANSDATIGAELVMADLTIGTEGIEVLGDSAYASGDMLHRLNEKQWTPLVKPWPLRPAVEDGFIIDDFTYDAAAGTLTCPAGVTRTPSAKGNVTFGVACRGCPIREQCTARCGARPCHQVQFDRLAGVGINGVAVVPGDQGFQHRPPGNAENVGGHRG